MNYTLFGDNLKLEQLNPASEILVMCSSELTSDAIESYFSNTKKSGIKNDNVLQVTLVDKKTYIVKLKTTQGNVLSPNHHVSRGLRFLLICHFSWLEMWNWIHMQQDLYLMVSLTDQPWRCTSQHTMQRGG